MRCVKPHCRTGSTSHNRHHKQHQYMFVSCFVQTRKGQALYEAFVDRYYTFLNEDTVDLCIPHHAEIHLLYDAIIRKDLKKVNKPLRTYSWKQAEALMEKLATACENWLKKETPGADPAILQGAKRHTKGGYQKAVAAQRKRLISQGK